jgi:hypothetical protein
MVSMDRKIQDVQTVLVKLVNHEADDLIVFFGHHTNAITLPQAPNEVIFIPSELETRVLDA